MLDSFMFHMFIGVENADVAALVVLGLLLLFVFAMFGLVF